jgi:P-type Cu2+ transporter
LSIAAALEHASEHPLARALRSAGVAAGVASQVRSHPGEGVEGSVEGHAWRVGRIDFVAAGRAQDLAAGLAALPPSCTIVALGDDHGVAALLGFADVLREEAPATVRELTRAGVASSLLSGDRVATVQSLGAQAGISDVRGALRPEDKRAAIVALQRRGAIVAMVGDGVNDAPALAAADVGISLGAATPLAQTSADLVMLDGRLDAIPAALAIARRTRRVIRENLAWALVYNAAALPAAACGFVTPLMASAGMAVSSLVVVANALRAGRATAP